MHGSEQPLAPGEEPSAPYSSGAPAPEKAPAPAEHQAEVSERQLENPDRHAGSSERESGAADRAESSSVDPALDSSPDPSSSLPSSSAPASPASLSSALPSSALPSSALPSSALPSSALPSSTLQSSAPLSSTPPPSAPLSAAASLASSHGSAGFTNGASSASRLLRECDEATRGTLEAALCQAVTLFLDIDLPIWLEGLGLLLPHQVTDHRAHLVGDSTIIRPETHRTVKFEKCSELVGYHRERYPNLVETKHIVQRLSPLLPPALQLRWSERVLGRLVRELFKHLRDEIVMEGFSRRLKGVGELCALFNRQGSSVSDWYAGADIFLVPTYRKVVSIGSARVFARPVMNDGWELLSAGYGAPVRTFEIDLERELTALGFESTSEECDAARRFGALRVAAFRMRSPGTAKEVVVFCTDGVRHTQGLGAELPARRSELLFQVDARGIEGDELTDARKLAVPWRALALAWVLLLHSGTKGIRIGSGYSCGMPLGNDAERVSRNSITGIFTTEFSAAKLEQLATDGAFYYVNVVGITEEEALIAEQISPHLLLKLLRHRGLDQVTKLGRPSLSVACASKVLSSEQARGSSDPAATSAKQPAPASSSAPEGSSGDAPLDAPPFA